MDQTYRLNLSAGAASVGTALFLVCLKLWALWATGALSVGASLADSAIDLVASIAGLVGIVYAAKPPDDDHSFGHSSVEDLVALGQALLVLGSAALIGWEALGRLGQPTELGQETAGLTVMLVATAVTVALVFWQGRVADRTGSRIVAADRLHYLSDMLPNVGAIVALYAAARFGALWVDPVVALAACALLVRAALRIGVDAWDALMDRRADPKLITRIETIVRNHPGVTGFHDLRTRRAGARLFVQVHIELDGTQSLNEAHAISAGVRHAIRMSLPGSDVIIHQDPV